jgi:hypothetical protein
MPYIGNQPAESFTSFATQEFSTSATTSYTLDHAVTNENEIALFINNVRQQPGSGKAYTATGTALTLSAATASTDTMYCVFLGRALQTVNPAGGSIGSSQLSADAITGQTALTVSPATTDEIILSDAGTLKRADISVIGSAPAFSAYIGSNQTLSDSTDTKADFDTEEFDTDSAYDTSNNRFTVPSGEDGKYFFHARGRFNMSANQSQFVIAIRKNGSEVAKKYIYSGAVGTKIFHSTTYFSYDISAVETLSVGDYVEVYVKSDDTGGNNITFESGTIQSEFSGYKLIGV